MTRTEIVQFPHPKALRRVVWWFSCVDERVRLDGYHVDYRDTTRHRWRVVEQWQRLDGRRNNVDKPLVPASIIDQALTTFRSQIVFQP